MRKLALLVSLCLLVLGMLPLTAAQAASDQHDAHLSLTVPSAITLTFTDGTEDFGSVLPGATVTRLNSIAYDVATNNPTGFKVSIGPVTTNAPLGMFKVSQDDFTVDFYSVNNCNCTLISNWRIENAAGSFSYADDYRAVVPASAIGSYSADVTYVATTQP